MFRPALVRQWIEISVIVSVSQADLSNQSFRNDTGRTCSTAIPQCTTRSSLDCDIAAPGANILTHGLCGLVLHR